MTTITTDQAGPQHAGPASVAYSAIPYEPRVPVAEGFLYEGEVTVIAGPGKSGKGLTLAGYAVRVALGLPRPGEGREVRHEPARVLWIAGGAEDDPMHDLRPRFEAAALSAAGIYGMAPGEALAGLARIHDLSAWADGSPVEVPQDRDRIAAEVAALNELDHANRAPGQDGYAGPGPRVALVTLDPLKGLLGPGQNLNAGARRVMTPLALLARGARCAVAVIHHVTKAGQVQGSPDVVNAVRLAFTVRPGKGAAPSALSLYASNIAAPDDVAFTLAGEGHLVHAVFTAEVPDAATGPGEVPSTLRQRIAAHDAAQDQGAPPAAAAPGTLRLLRRRYDRAGQPGRAQVLGTYRDLAMARTAAEEDAGVPRLRWLADVATVRDHASGGSVTYALAR